MWPARLRASGMELDYGVGNLGKIFSSLRLALIVGASDSINPKATLDALGSAFLYLAFWYCRSPKLGARKPRDSDSGPPVSG